MAAPLRCAVFVGTSTSDNPRGTRGFPTVVVHDFLVASETVKPTEKHKFLEILERRASPALQQEALKLLIDLLARYHHQPVVVLIDEYDTPLQLAYLKGFHQEEKWNLSNKQRERRSSPGEIQLADIPQECRRKVHAPARAAVATHGRKTALDDDMFTGKLAPEDPGRRYRSSRRLFRKVLASILPARSSRRSGPRPGPSSSHRAPRMPRCRIENRPYTPRTGIRSPDPINSAIQPSLSAGGFGFPPVRQP